MRNYDLWNFSLENGTDYITLARALRAAGLRQTVLCLFNQGGSPAEAPALAREEEETRKLAADAGLAVEPMYDDGTQAVLRFTLLI